VLKKVVYVALLVSNQDNALDFYTNIIGLEKRADYSPPDEPRWLTVGIKGQDLELVLWPGTPAKAAPAKSHLRSGAKAEAGVVSPIEVENCRAAFETLKSRGVKFEPPEILEFAWGDTALFRDPDGNQLQVREGRRAFRG